MKGKTESKKVKSSMQSASNSMLYLFQVVICSGLPLISIPIITHQLAPAEYGLFALAFVYATVATGMANWGVAVGYERNYFLYENQPEKSGALLTSSIAFVALNIAVLMATVWVWKNDISAFIFGSTDYGLMLFLLVGGTSLSSLANYYLIYLKNLGSASSYVQLMILQSVSNFILILLFLLYFKLGLYSLVYAFFLSNMIFFLVVMLLQLRELPVTLNKAMLWDVLKISLPLTPRVFFGFLGTQFDKMMLGMMASMGGVGIYSIGQKVAGVIFLFMTALDQVFIPELYRRLFAQERESQDNIGEYLTPFVYVSILIAILFVLFSEELFIALMPESYTAGVDIVIVLSLYYASMFIGKVTGTQLIYAKKTHITTLLTFIAIVLNILLNIPMIIQWGAIGAAWATMIAGVFINILSYRVAQRYANIKWDLKALVWAYGVFIITTVYMLVVRMTFANEWLFFIFAGKVLFVIAYLYLGKKLGLVTLKNIHMLYLQVVAMFQSKKGT